MSEKRPEALGQADIDAFADQTPQAGRKARSKKKWPLWAGVLTALAVLAAAVILLPGLLGQEDPVPGTETDDPAHTAAPVTVVNKQTGAEGEVASDLVRAVSVTSLQGSYGFYTDENGIVRMEGDPNVPLNGTEVLSLFTRLSKVEAEDTVAAHVTDMDQYGFSLPAVTASVTYADGESVTLDMAAMAVGKKHYLRVRGEDTVYLVSAGLPEALIQPVEQFVSLSLIASPEVSPEDPNGTPMMKEFSLTGPVRDNVITTLRRKTAEDSEEFANTNFLVTAPYLLAADAGAVTEFFATPSLTAQETVVLHPTDAQLEEYGLKEPRSVAKLVVAVYTSLTDESGETTEGGSYNESVHLIRLGKSADNGTAYYCMADAVDAVYKVSADSVPWAEKTYHDYASRYLFMRHLNTLRSITCTLDGREYDFRFQHFPEEEELDDTLRVTVDGQTYATDQFRTLFQVLMTIYRTGPAPAEPAGEPLLTVKITSLDDSFSVNEISIYPYSASAYIARTEQGDTYKVTASRVDDAMEQIRRYLRGEEVVNRF